MYREEEVRRGIALLNERVPDWRSRVNLDTLYLGNVRECVLGQLYGHFLTGAMALLEMQPSADYGFSSHGGLSVPLSELREDYTKLTETWKALIYPVV